MSGQEATALVMEAIHEGKLDEFLRPIICLAPGRNFCQRRLSADEVALEIPACITYVDRPDESVTFRQCRACEEKDTAERGAEFARCIAAGQANWRDWRIDAGLMAAGVGRRLGVSGKQVEAWERCQEVAPQWVRQALPEIYGIQSDAERTR